MEIGIPHGENPDLAAIVRAESGRILATLVAIGQDIQLAEDALQEAFLQAAQQWPKNGAPAVPVAWLLTTAKRRLIDKLRVSSRNNREEILARAHEELSPLETANEASHHIPDERLKLIFTCCHPALNQQAQVALTLKTLCALSAREIARAYLVSEVTMNQRLVRAKQKIRKAGITYKVPEEDDLDLRLESVLATLYLIYNESYSAFEGQNITRQDLADEAIRLARVLNSLLPVPSTAGLLALMLLHQARNNARSSSSQPFIALQFQDRTLWDKDKISEGRRILLTALSTGKPEKYQLQAAISALHSEADSWEETDWPQIYLLYKTLLEFHPSPVIELNGIVALAQTGQVAKALSQLQGLYQVLEDYQPLYAAKADLEAKLMRLDEAKASYEKAIAMSNNEAERTFLKHKLDSL